MQIGFVPAISPDYLLPVLHSSQQGDNFSFKLVGLKGIDCSLELSYFTLPNLVLRAHLHSTSSRPHLHSSSTRRHVDTSARRHVDTSTPALLLHQQPLTHNLTQCFSIAFVVGDYHRIIERFDRFYFEFESDMDFATVEEFEKFF